MKGTTTYVYITNNIKRGRFMLTLTLSSNLTRTVNCESADRIDQERRENRREKNI